MADSLFMVFQTFLILSAVLFFYEERAALSDILFIIVLSTICFTLYQFADLNASIFLYLSLVFLLYRKNKNFWISITSTTIIYVVLILSDNIIGIIIGGLNLGHISHELYLIVVLFTSTMIIYLFLFFLGKRIITLIKNTELLVLVGLLSLLTSVIFFGNIYLVRYLNIGKYTEVLKLNFFSFTLYLIILSIVLVIYSRTSLEKIRMRQEKVEYDNLQMYVGEIETQYNEMRKFRHDYQNVISSLDGFFEEDDYEGLKKYYNEYIQVAFDNISHNNFRLENLSNIKSRELKSVFSSKIILAQEQGIDASFEAKDIVEQIDMNPIQLIRMIGIILDNAIEELLTIESGSLHAGVIVENDSIIIIVENTCNKDNLKLHELKKEGFTTKQNHDGLGLAILDEIISKNSNLFLETALENNKFIQKIIVFNK